MNTATAMDPAHETWIARIAVALCFASRWIFVFAVALTVVAALRLMVLPPEHLLARLGLSLVRRCGWLLAAQFAVLLAAAWLGW